MAPPSMTVGTVLPFQRTFLFRALRPYDSARTGRPVEHATDPQLAADSRSATDVPLDREMYVNFLASRPAGGIEPLRLTLRWGKDRRGEVVVGERLVAQSRRWQQRLERETVCGLLPVSIDFPDGRTMLFHELALTESPRGVVAQPGQPVF